LKSSPSSCLEDALDGESRLDEVEQVVELDALEVDHETELLHKEFEVGGHRHFIDGQGLDQLQPQ